MLQWLTQAAKRIYPNGKIKPRTNGKAAVPKGKVSSGPLAKAAIQEPKGIAKLVEAVEKDYMFLLAYLVIKSTIEAAKFSVESEGDPRGERLANNLAEVWKESLAHMIRCVAFGRSAFEKWYAYDRASGLQLVGGLDYLDFQYTKMRLSDDGAFEGIELTVKDRTECLGPERCWWLALDPTAREPHGRSRYLGAPLEVWKLRQGLDKNEEKWQKRFALGHGFAKAPSEYPTDGSVGKGDIGEKNPDGTPANPIIDMQQVLENISSGGSAVVASGNHPDGSPLYEYNPPASRQDAGPIENQRKRLDAAALRSMGIPERAVTQDDATGSYAMAEVHWRVLGSTCEGILSQIRASFQKYVIDKAVQINFAAGTKLTAVTQPINDTAMRVLVTEIVKAVAMQPQLSPLLAQGVIDLGKLLEITGLPAGDDVEGKLAAIAATPPPAPAGFPMSRRLARDTVPEVQNWEAYADEQAKEARKILERIKSMPRESVDRGLLRQPLDGLSDDPCQGHDGGETGGDADTVEAATVTHTHTTA